ncbi:MAG: hypothetical protein ABIB97_02205 [Patescibacteria group bacterium]
MKGPYAVTAPGGKLNLMVMDASDGVPAAFALMGTLAERKVALRLGGGCKGMDTNDKAAMLAYFRDALRGFNGLIWSGGTRQVDGNDQVNPMVTDVPGVIAAENPGAVALGTVPRVEMLTLQQDSRLVLDQWGTVPNPTMSGILVVQNGPDGELDWDGDVDTYIAMMESWRTYANFTALGLVAWNGGAVTEQEIIKAASKGWPVILIKGSGRVTDEIATKLAADDPALIAKLPQEFKIIVADIADPNTLRVALTEHGFLG